MSATIVLPTIIQGPAYILHGGVVIYTESDVTVEEIVETWTPKSTFGDLGERLKSRMFRVSATPVGMVTSGLLNYFFCRAHRAADLRRCEHHPREQLRADHLLPRGK